MGRRGPQGNGAATAFDDGAADGESEAEAPFFVVQNASNSRS